MEKRRIPWPGLGTVYDEAEWNAVTAILRRCMDENEGIDVRYVGAEFERTFAVMTGANEAVAVNSCGTALDIATMILNPNPGDEFITTPLTFICTATTVIAQGATVRFADIDEKTWNIDPKSIEACVNGRTRAIYPVHYAGLACDMARILGIAERKGLAVVEDAAHALGTTHQGKPVGGLGDMTAFSFQSMKNMTTLGEGGMLTTNNAEYAKAAREIRSFGFDYSRGTSVRLGTNLRMTLPQAAVGLTQLDKVERLNRRRRELAGLMNEKLAEVDEIQLPLLPNDDQHPVHLYTIYLNERTAGMNRAEFRKLLNEECGVDTRANYDPVYDHEVLRQRGYDGSGTPVADRICRGLVNLPLHPSYTEADVNFIAAGVKQTLAGRFSGTH